jgi:hypothetical protein
MRHFNLLRNIIIVSGLILPALSACKKDYGSPYTDVEFTEQIRIFDGTVYDYLSQPDTETGLRYDSLKLIIDGIEGRREFLSDTSVNLTVFAVPNECFQSTMNICNRVRQSAGMVDLILDSLLIEPFSVPDTVYTPTESIEDDPELNDTVITFRHYDYRRQLDSLLCRYIFEGLFDFDVIAENFRGIEPGCYIYNIKMNIASEQQTASGILNSGRKRILFSDMNDAKVTGSWVRSIANSIDIHTQNGVIHVLSTGHEFGFDDFIYCFKKCGYEK